jgi:NadR type nicotinamide-nucleotide adenylyltransferase
MANHKFTPTRTPTFGHVAIRERVARVVVTGGECTGKTTLALRLARKFGVPSIDEYARTYAASAGRALTASDVEPIARGQVAAEDSMFAQWQEAAASNHIPPMVVLDTDLVSTTVYADFYYGGTPEWVRDEARERLGDLYLLCAPDIRWESDGIRDLPLPQARADVHQRFVTRLRELGATTLLVTGQGDQRFDVATAAVRGWRAAMARGLTHR